MSWVERIKSPLKIITGDGAEYSPIWKNPTQAKQYNISEFNFPGVRGTKVDRALPRGRVFPLEFYFQGEDHLDETARFVSSADDPRAWTVFHPYYGELLVQPSGLDIDNTGDNVSKIKCTLLETISEDNPKTSVDPRDEIGNQQLRYLDRINLSYDEVTFDVSGLRVLQSQVDSVYTQSYPKIKLTIDATEFTNRFQAVQAAILRATEYPMAVMEETNRLIAYVAEFKVEAELQIVGNFSTSSVQNRINALKDSYNSITSGLDTIQGRLQKMIFSSTLGSLISSMCLSSSTPENDDYGSANDALSVMGQILEFYNGYISSLDFLQTENGGSVDSFIPDFESTQALSELVKFTVSNLYSIALSSKQERSILCEKNTNVIELAHRFYGLTEDDSTINKIIRTNNIGLNETLTIRKGRRIVYYV